MRYSMRMPKGMPSPTFRKVLEMCAMSTEFIDEDFSAVPSTLLKRMARYKVTRAENCINCGLCECCVNPDVVRVRLDVCELMIRTVQNVGTSWELSE